MKSCEKVLTSADLMEEAEKLKADKAEEKRKEIKRSEKAKQKSIVEGMIG